MGSLGYFLTKNQILSHIIMWLIELFAELNLGKNQVKIQILDQFKTLFDEDTES